MTSYSMEWTVVISIASAYVTADPPLCTAIAEGILFQLAFQLSGGVSFRRNFIFRLNCKLKGLRRRLFAYTKVHRVFPSNFASLVFLDRGSPRRTIRAAIMVSKFYYKGHQFTPQL